MEKNAYHTKFMQNLKGVLKNFNEYFWFHCFFASFEAFWSLKKLFKNFDDKCLSYSFHVRKLIENNFFIEKVNFSKITKKRV